jgi:hypothetical protein
MTAGSNRQDTRIALASTASAVPMPRILRTTMREVPNTPMETAKRTAAEVTIGATFATLSLIA